MTDTRTKPTAYYGRAETAMGPMLIAGSGRTLVAIKFGVTAKRLAAEVENLHRELHGAYTLVADAKKVAPLTRQLVAYLDGKRKDWDVDLDLSWVTPFRREVLLATYGVPRGQVATYAEIAARVGSPRAARAVGNTMRTNPIPIVIPCHRIVGSDGSLTGFGGGLEMKYKLLKLEGVALPLT